MQNKNNTTESHLAGARSIPTPPLETEHPVTDSDVVKQLLKIQNCTLFENKNRPKNFIGFVVKEKLSGRGHLLKGYTIGIEVFDKPETFDPSTDAIVRVEAGRLRRLLENYYLNEGLNDAVLIELPKGTYVPLFTRVNINNKEIDPILAEAAAPSTGPAVAVLRFDNLTEDASLNYFAIGITEEIISHLSLSLGLFVLSRTATAGYESSSANVTKICDELEVQYMLHGSIRQSGDNLRVTVQLIDAVNGSVIWANSYDRQVTASNLLSLQDDIADHVASAVGDTYGIVMRNSALLNAKRPTTEHMDVYQSMVSFHDYFYKLSEKSHLIARKNLEDAVKIDPLYSEAWAGLGFLALDEYRFSFNPVKGLDPLQKAREYVEKSIALNGKISVAWYVMTLIFFHKEEYDNFKQNIRMALSLGPNNSAVLADSGLYLCLLGDFDQGLPLVHKAIDLNPQHPGWCNFALFLTEFIKEDYEKAQEYVYHIDTADWFWPYVLQAINYSKLGQKEASDKASAQVLRLYPEFKKNHLNECNKWLKDNKTRDIFIRALQETVLTDD